MASSFRFFPMPRNYGSTELNFTPFDFNQLAPQKVHHGCPEWQDQQCHSTTPSSEISEDHIDEAEGVLELCYTRSNSSSGDNPSSPGSRSGLSDHNRALSPPRNRKEQDAFIEDVIGRLSAYSLTAAREERRLNKKPTLSRTPVSGEDAALWMRVWGSAHAVREARTRRRTRDVTRMKPV